MAEERRFCLVTSAHVTNNPRIVKEADALAAVGADVRVVSLSTSAATAARDRELAAHRRWRLIHLDVARSGPSHRRWLAGAVRQSLSRAGFSAGFQVGAAADMAASRHLYELADCIASEPSDVVIAHNLPALPAAGRAARRLGARLGFDAEDLHAEEVSEGPGAERHRRLASAVERFWLPRCDYLTASSDGIAREIERRYGVVRPHVVLNTFPQAMRSESAHQRDRVGPSPSLYWYSQTLGPDRGLEDTVRAMAGLPGAVQLHLRGRADNGYRAHLTGIARAHGAEGKLHFHEPEPPDDMVGLAAQHDIGLATEQPVCVNKLLCASNKLFTYLLAGLAVAASDLPGQRQIIESAPGAGFLYTPGDPDGLRAGLWALLASPARLALAKERALAAALERYSWEYEAPRLVAYLSGVRGSAMAATSIANR